MVAWLTFCGEGDWWLAFVEKVVGGWRGGEGGEAMLAVVGKVVRMVWFVERRVWLWWLSLWLVQNNDSKRIMANSKITARLTRIIPFKQRWGNLSEHTLIGITDLGTFMVFCEFPQP